VSVKGLVGLMGSGKTLRLVQWGLTDLKLGRELWANFQIGRRVEGYLVPECPVWPTVMCDPRYHAHKSVGRRFVVRSPLMDRHAQEFGYRRGKAFVRDPNTHVLTSWDDLMELRVFRDEFGIPHKRGCRMLLCKGCSKGITVLIDELNLWAPSRLWQETGIGVLNRWAYARKDGLDIFWTAQHEARIDKVAREVTEHIWACSKIGGIYKVGALTLPLVVFHRKRWIPALMTEKNRVASGEGAKSSGVFGMDMEIAFWPSLRRAVDSYDTYEHVSDAGVGQRAATRAAARERPLREVSGSID
jgi:hypothetical protein